MYPYVASALSALFVFIALDAAWLYSMAGFYKKHLGHILADSPNFLAAGAFYVIYITALSALIVVPALRGDASLLKTFALGALFGFAAYATYDLTNHATVRDWPLVVTLVDLAWGALITGAVAALALAAGRYFRERVLGHQISCF